MRYILTTGWEDGVAALTERLIHELAAGQRVLWLVSGGSNIPASVQVLGSVSPELSMGLSIMLVDERYGSPGHADSNWAQLERLGFRNSQAKMLPILRDGDSFAQSIAYYQELAEQALGSADVIIAQLGIGLEGHLAGILPDSPAAHEAKALATGYKAPDFKRLTLTFPALKRIDAAYAFSFGEAKHDALQQLKTQKLEPAEQPAQILKQLTEAYLYNDQIGEPA